ncbi:hypothetical protein AUJ66_03205 [Candidatus Desantisbacteria bacterium CG1_02_38_46]|uniref:Tc1-like transposase DDE domain-containing protein n=1 Tax=Candidatus Desantisbacteria bacterium CG1_02_38_46 TaxID=1817893 RepID=A0A1J4SFU0_9BACT|nr:MAG: hypothetical protein AUJ66_03205 [Candidatus Desantisbacteria bacterium CG1_02_38_46]
MNPEPAARSFFFPEEIAQIKALACQLPAERGIPLSRFSITEIVREVISAAIVPSVSDSSVWRWLHEDAIRPWFHRSWIYPRDTQFIEKSGKVLDLYARQWEGNPLGPDDYSICADEKTSIQARIRKHSTTPPSSGKPMKVEHEYTRGGAWTYLAAWDVHRAKIFGRCEAKSGIEPFDRLVDQVMSQAPYNTAKRVFWIVDNGSSHRGQPFVERLQKKWPNAIAVHLPVHASWLNQIEIYFAIVQRKVLTPNDFPSGLGMVEKRLLDFQFRYQEIAHPFKWKFNRQDLKERIKLISDHVIEQYQPTISQDSNTEEFPFRSEIQETSYAYA